MTELERHETSMVGQVDREAILRYLNLDPSKTDTQALLLICERYGLDPLLKHMVLISGRPYVTRDGYLAVAHRSGHLDGIEVVDSGEDDNYWWAKVAVYRNDMSHPFVFVGRYPKADAKHMTKYGPEMAIKCGEVMALRRAFNVSGIGAADEQWDEHVPAAVPVTADTPVDWEALGWVDKDAHDAALEDCRGVARRLPDPHRGNVKDWVQSEQGAPPYSHDFMDEWAQMMDDLTAERPVVDTADPTLDEGRPFTDDEPLPGVTDLLGTQK